MRSRSPTLARFTKMHALGNDFVVLDAVTQPMRLSPARAAKIANRHTGIGCDQILLVEPPTRPDIDFHYRIFNQDGSEVAQCGNGARCFAKFVRDRKLTGKNRIRVSTLVGELELVCNPDRSYSVELGQPNFEPACVPMDVPRQEDSYRIDTSEGEQSFFALSLGNPHAVIPVEDIDTAPVASVGQEFQQHAMFPESVNVGFMQRLDEYNIRLRVYERGAGETLACGSGACAAAIAGIRAGLLKSPVTVNLLLGSLEISWPGGESPVVLKGPATTVFQGRIRI